ncbi:MULTISPECIES: hypothetical protein [Clostridium]|uniref:Uncharacterized protein n=1 Tax=Clostridium aquiflavi TaxID=3073603 RepID=A0ABU1EEJ6_9CLOT|nr:MULTISPECIES: hypothetical protein [unclassified Clostridium]MDR5586374.1 hypothetical protein [Clostridium sp. 5N-1]NFG63377.1 hypothetical protein [Clostridium botulinum]NFQ09143.1 hypothetical protein [Clostridium botulinum]
MKNCDYINYDYYVPMGKPGSLIAKIPIVLTYFEFSFPLYFKLEPNNYINLNDNSRNSNRVIIDKISLNKNKQLIINGIFIKKIKCSDMCDAESSNKCTTIKISINKVLNIKFLHKPNLSTNKTNIFNKHNINPIKYTIEHVKISDSSYSSQNNNSINKIILSIKLYLSQVQSVFIPEPDGNFVLLNKNSPSFKCTNPNCSDLYVVGFNKDKGLIADYNYNFYK